MKNRSFFSSWSYLSMWDIHGENPKFLPWKPGPRYLYVCTYLHLRYSFMEQAGPSSLDLIYLSKMFREKSLHICHRKQADFLLFDLIHPSI
jgi:hypothetical protein